MVIKSRITMDSPRAVREMLKTLARLAGEREDYATCSATTLKRWDDGVQPEVVASRERLEDEVRIARAKADTARYLLIEAWVAAGYDEEGRRWISRMEAETLADAMIKIVLAARNLPAMSRVDLDDVFSGTIEVS